MKLTLDHFMYAASDLDALREQFYGLTGVSADLGGVHPGLGTRNALASLGQDVYLELIAPDPQQNVPGSWGALFRNFSQAQIFTYVVKCADIELSQERLAELGFKTELINASRTTPSGQVIRWRLLLPEANRFANFFPIFIDWLDSQHPAESVVTGCQLVAFEIGHPEATELSRIFAVLAMDVAVVHADRPYFQARIQTPQGLVVLNSAT